MDINRFYRQKNRIAQLNFQFIHYAGDNYLEYLPSTFNAEPNLLYSIRTLIRCHK